MDDKFYYTITIGYSTTDIYHYGIWSETDSFSIVANTLDEIKDMIAKEAMKLREKSEYKRLKAKFEKE